MKCCTEFEYWLMLTFVRSTLNTVVLDLAQSSVALELMGSGEWSAKSLKTATSHSQNANEKCLF